MSDRVFDINAGAEELGFESWYEVDPDQFVLGLSWMDAVDHVRFWRDRGSKAVVKTEAQLRELTPDVTERR